MTTCYSNRKLANALEPRDLCLQLALSPRTMGLEGTEISWVPVQDSGPGFPHLCTLRPADVLPSQLPHYVALQRSGSGSSSCSDEEGWQHSQTLWGRPGLVQENEAVSPAGQFLGDYRGGALSMPPSYSSVTENREKTALQGEISSGHRGMWFCTPGNLCGTGGSCLAPVSAALGGPSREQREMMNSSWNGAVG